MSQILYVGEAPNKDSMLASLWAAPVIAVDTETINLKDKTCVGIGIQWSDTERLYIPVLPESNDSLPSIMGKIGSSDCTKLLFNAPFDIRTLQQLAYEEGLTPPDYHNIEDVSVAAQIQGNAEHSLDELSLKYLDYSNQYSIKGLLAEAGRGATTLDIPMEQLGTKCTNDCWATWHLWKKLNSSWPNTRNKDCYDVDMKVLPRLLQMEQVGLGLRQALLSEHSTRLQYQVEQLATSISNRYGFEAGSGQQLGYILATMGVILPFTKSKKQLATDEETLESVTEPEAQELIAQVLEYRGLVKTLGTYITPLQKMDRARPEFRLDLATGRLAGGVWMTLPPELREVFRPDKNVFSWMDFSQIELRVLAYVSKDKVMRYEYASESPDLHTKTAKAGGVSRDAGKTFNFAKIFGAGDRQLHRKTGVELSRIAGLRAAWDGLYPDAASWIYNSMYQHNGDYVETDYGRRMALPRNLHNANPKAFAAHVGKTAVNYPIQGTAADVMKRALLSIPDADVRMPLHDELLVDGPYDWPESLAHVHPELHTPFEAKTDWSWK